MLQPIPKNLLAIVLAEDVEATLTLGNFFSLHPLQKALFFTKNFPSIIMKNSSPVSIRLPHSLHLAVFQRALPEYSFTIISQLIIHNSQIKTFLGVELS